MTLVPASADIMIEYGLHCFSCSVGGVETLAEGCQMHGFDTETVEALVEDINSALGDAPKRPQTLVITADAARGIRDIASVEKKDDQILVVTLDEQGGFCLEFQEKPLLGDIEFTNPEVSDVRIFASVLTLSRIGGSTIDICEGRFKLDLPDEEGGCCGNSNTCECKTSDNQ